MTVWSKYLPTLRNRGYKRVDRHEYLVVYEKEMVDRVISVQLWKKGKHRVSVSHSHSLTDFKSHLHSNTRPQTFDTHAGMIDAISYQENRKIDCPMYRNTWGEFLENYDVSSG